MKYNLIIENGIVQGIQYTIEKSNENNYVSMSFNVSITTPKKFNEWTEQEITNIYNVEIQSREDIKNFIETPIS